MLIVFFVFIGIGVFSRLTVCRVISVVSRGPFVMGRAPTSFIYFLIPVVIFIFNFVKAGFNVGHATMIHVVRSFVGVGFKLIIQIEWVISLSGKILYAAFLAFCGTHIIIPSVRRTVVRLAVSFSE
jgi:hypothetical protein